MCGLHSTDFYFYHPILHCIIYHILYCTINNGSKPCVAGVAFSFSFLQLSQSLLTEHFVHFTMKIKVHGTFMDTICTINSLFTIPTSPLHHCTTATLHHCNTATTTDSNIHGTFCTNLQLHLLRPNVPILE